MSDPRARDDFARLVRTRTKAFNGGFEDIGGHQFKSVFEPSSVSSPDSSFHANHLITVFSGEVQRWIGMTYQICTSA